MSVFPPIAEYAFLSDCEVSTLVAPDGSVEWLCLPRPDSSSVFGALLDRVAGTFRFGPSHAMVPDSRRYVPGTMVLETTWHTPTGWLTVKDMLVMGPPDIGHRRADVRRVPGDATAQGTLLRIATCFGGRVEIVTNCIPMFDYARTTGAWSYDGEGYDKLVVAHEGVELAMESSLASGSSVPAATAGPRSNTVSPRSSRSRGAATDRTPSTRRSASSRRPRTSGASG